MKIMGKPKLFIPGPTHVDEEILNAFTEYPVGHRTPSFSELYDNLVSGIQKVLFTDNRIYLCTCTATGLWEAAVRNTVRKRCANFICGAFSSRWHDSTVMCGLPADAIHVELGKAIKPDLVDNTLATGKYDVMTYVHNETSTGVMNPLGEIAQIMKKYPDVMFLVDMVSSMSSVKIEVDDLGIDVALASVQKGWALPPGFSVCSVSERTLDISAKCINKGLYFDFLVLEKYAKRSQTPSTPSIPHMYGLKRQLERIFAEGIENRFQRHRDLADRVRVWALDRMGLFPELGYESATLTCVENTRGIDITDFQNRLLEKGYMISGGYGPLKEKTFRISHMGDIMLTDIEELLSVIDETLNEMN